MVRAVLAGMMPSVTDGSADCSERCASPFFQHNRELVVSSPQDTLAFQAGGYGGVEVVGDAVELDDASHSGSGVFGCLEQPGDDTRFVNAELAGSFV
jgi:hypothetical protein